MRIKKKLCKIAVIGVLTGMMSFASSVVDMPIISGTAVVHAQEYDAEYLKEMKEAGNLAVQQKYDAAINICNKLIKKYPTICNTYSYRGYLYMTIKQYDKALADVNKALELANPDTDFEQIPHIYGNKVRIYKGMNKLDKVRENQEKQLEAYAKVIQKKPNDSTYYTLRANLYAELGDNQKAIADYKKAISLPHSVPAELKALGYTENKMLANDYFMCAHLYQKMKDYKNAIAMYTKAIELAPDESTYLLLRGQCYKAIGENDKAKADSVEYEMRLSGGK